MLKQKLSPLELSSYTWGVTPQSVFLYLLDCLNKENGQQTRNLDLSYKLEVIRHNCRRPHDQAEEAISWLCSYLDLANESSKTVLPLGLLTLSSIDPLFLVRCRLASSDNYVRRFVAHVLAKSIDTMKIAEFQSIFPESANTYAKLLSSFGFVVLSRSAIKPNTELFRMMEIVPFEPKIGNWIGIRDLVKDITGLTDRELINDIADAMLNRLGISFERTDQLSLSLEELMMHLTFPIGQLASRFFSSLNDFKDILQKKRESLRLELNSIGHHIANVKGSDTVSTSTKTAVDFAAISRKYKVDDRVLANTLYAAITIHKEKGKVLTSYVSHKLGLDTKETSKMLYEIFGDKVKLDAEYCNFDILDLEGRVFPSDFATTSNEEYLQFAFDRYLEKANTLKSINKRLASDNTHALLKERIQDNLILIKGQMLDELQKLKVAPHYFVYTLLNPDTVGNEAINRYSKDNDALKTEVVLLKTEWPLVRTDNSMTYIDAADKLFAKGVAEDLKVKELRIMTPFSDYELDKYVSIMRSLIIKGYKIYLLWRLSSKPHAWRVFRESLVEGLGEKSKSLEVRTYTRFKEYKKRDELKHLTELERKEFGVHAKLYIIGDVQDGAALLGSANLLENSFRWNPECGIYSEDPNFIRSAKVFFDFVWELSKRDSLDMSKMERIHSGPYFPDMY